MNRMHDNRRPLRVALFGLTVTLVGYALFAAWLGGHAYAHARERERTATTFGEVVERGLGADGDDVLVSWEDRAGRTHLQRFPDRGDTAYTRQTLFLVAYDPTEDNPRGRPIDWRDIPKEDGYEDDLVRSVAFGGVVAAVLCGVWAHRGLRFLRAARRPGRPATALVRVGERGAPLGRGLSTTWLVLGEQQGPRWQRVMWHPALDELPDRAPVSVHGRRTAVVVLPDGTQLVPLGRLRRSEPRHTTLEAPSTVRGDLRDSFVIPAGTVIRPTRPWWRPALPFTATGAVLGLALAYLNTDGTVVPVVAFTLAGATLLTAVWAPLALQP
ncbi:hypothetical protein HLK59_39055 [Streptomyces sp. S3(2020)]|uniref:hypothetical protein n=1 Tax=Streptomyces sp. S3(2020) TaxID=2732044 RepID=UPI001487D483|nr:hypothetical protein [Streptomyces sp. S3(2020)]NNN36257.1 hypothetical protein [Streptomyces sp. S3(2020)]